MANKPSSAEDEYFAREDAEKKRQLALTLSQAMAQQEREGLRLAHHQHCPACGQKLHDIALHGVQALRCFFCNGVFLSADNLQRLGGAPGYWQRILQFFVARDYGKPDG